MDQPARRRILKSLVAAAALGARPALAQGKRPVRVIVPFTPGTGPDIVARLLAPKLQERWDQPFVVDNRPGASGTLGADLAAKAAPDGHTLMVGPASAVTAPHLYKSLPYDVVRDLTPIVNVGSTSLALVVHRAAPVGSVQEFLAWVRSQPGKLNYGSPGNGTHHHMSMELLKVQTGIDIVHVPYKGSSGAENDLIAGVIPAMFLPIHVALPKVRAGQVKVLGQTLLARHPLFPEVPSLDEQGVKGYDVDLWLGVWGPAKLGADWVHRYNREIREIIDEPEMRAQLAKQALVPAAGTPEAFARLVKDDYERWGRVMRAANIRAD